MSFSQTQQIGRFDLNAALMADDMKPANCRTINGAIEEGFYLDLGHPVSGGKPSIILGENAFLARDGRDGCLYRMTDRGGFVRRASVGEFEAPGGKTYPVLQRASDEKTLVVHVYFGLNEHVRLNAGFDPLWSGVIGGHTASCGRSKAVVEVKRGDFLSIFYPNGVVAKVDYTDLKSAASLADKLLSAENSLAERLQFVDAKILGARSIEDDDRRRKAEDRWFHELAAMVRMTSIFPTLRDKILNVVERHSNGGLRGGVRKHLHGALCAVGDSTYYGWLADLYATADDMPAFIRQHRGPQKPRDLKADRRQRDRKERAAKKTPKGSSG